MGRGRSYRISLKRFHAGLRRGAGLQYRLVYLAVSIKRVIARLKAMNCINPISYLRSLDEKNKSSSKMVLLLVLNF